MKYLSKSFMLGVGCALFITLGVSGFVNMGSIVDAGIASSTIATDDTASIEIATKGLGYIFSTLCVGVGWLFGKIEYDSAS